MTGQPEFLGAQAPGVHPFCITVDRKAREYTVHLPRRIPKIFRTLTT